MRKEYDFRKGRRGAVVPVPVGKTRITIRLDEDVLTWFRAQVHATGGGNYQTLINQALRQYVSSSSEPLDDTLRRVFREELRGPAPPDVGDDPERRREERGGQPERRLVEQDEPRPRHQGARDGEHLLLAARERACRLSTALGEEREVGDDALEVLVHGATVAPNVRAHLEVLPDGEVGEDATSLGTVGDAGREDVRGLGAVDRAPVEHDAPARGGEQAGNRAQR